MTARGAPSVPTVTCSLDFCDRCDIRRSMSDSSRSSLDSLGGEETPRVTAAQGDGGDDWLGSAMASALDNDR